MDSQIHDYNKKCCLLIQCLFVCLFMRPVTLNKLPYKAHCIPMRLNSCEYYIVSLTIFQYITLQLMAGEINDNQ